MLPIAEKHMDGTWSDFIYAGGQKVARAESADRRLHFSATSCDGCNGHYLWWWSAPVPAGLTIQQGSKLMFRQYQSGPALPWGGIYMNTDTGEQVGWIPDQNGQVVQALSTQNTWVQRSTDLSVNPEFVGHAIAYIWMGVEGYTGAGPWDLYLADVAVVQPDGTVFPIYNGQAASGWPQWGSQGVQNQTMVSETVPSASDPTGAGGLTHYYASDHLGSTRMEFAGGGWPVWSGDYDPYGKEINPQPTVNNYKFTGYERDAETGLDYAHARYYMSSIGRFISPDRDGRMVQAQPVLPCSAG